MARSEKGKLRLFCALKPKGVLLLFAPRLRLSPPFNHNPTYRAPALKELRKDPPNSSPGGCTI